MFARIVSRGAFLLAVVASSSSSWSALAFLRDGGDTIVVMPHRAEWMADMRTCAMLTFQRTAVSLSLSRLAVREKTKEKIVFGLRLDERASAAQLRQSHVHNNCVRRNASLSLALVRGSSAN